LDLQVKESVRLHLLLQFDYRQRVHIAGDIDDAAVI
jgi:hypothetical protein